MKVLFLGTGRIATALATGLRRAKPEVEIFGCDVSAAARDAFVAATGAQGVEDPAAAAQQADAILLCVKPGDVEAALLDTRPGPQLLISVAAGISTTRLDKLAPAARILRAMPNTAALARASATALAAGPRATEADVATAEAIFLAAGRVVRVEEKMMDAITGLSGSGPAYFFLVVEALADGGVAAGLPRALALELAAATMEGAAALLRESGRHPALLREEVTSPGGTTAAGLMELERGAARATFASAVLAAARRSAELVRA